jgi:uncharacterized protein (DUF2236 family)
VGARDEPDDAGLFGPASITWRIHADPVMGLGGLRALHLQALHPLAMAGVAQHSDFRADPWGRLLRTVNYVTTVSFGTTAQVDRAAARVRGIHRPLHGVEPESGAAYRVDDPELLRWVHCCLADSFLTTFRRAGGALTAAEADRYVAEQVRAAALVGLDPDCVPANVADLAAYFTAMRPALRATREARRAATFVLLPPMPNRWLGPARPLWRPWPERRSRCCRAGHAGCTACPECPRRTSRRRSPFAESGGRCWSCPRTSARRRPFATRGPAPPGSRRTNASQPAVVWSTPPADHAPAAERATRDRGPVTARPVDS